MEEMITPMSLGDIFDRTFRMFGKTALRAITIGVILILPVSLLVIWGTTSFFSTMGSVMQGVGSGETMDTETARRIGIGMVSVLPLLMLGELLLILAVQTVYISVMEMVAGEMMGDTVPWREALGNALRGKMWKSLVQQIVMQLAFLVILILPFAMMIPAAMGLRNSGNSGAAGSFAVLLFAVAVCGIFYLSFRWVYSVTSIAVEDTGIFESMGRSWKLVGGQWWRTFGIMLVLGLVAFLAISLLSVPVLFLGLSGMFSTMTEQLSREANPDPSAVFAALSHMGLGMGIYIAFVSILSSIITPVYLTVMFFDARARKGEFEESDPDVDIQFVS